MNEEKLFDKLRDLGYTEVILLDDRQNSVAHEIMEFYRKYGNLDSCKLVKQEHRIDLAAWYAPKNIVDIFDNPIACSGVIIRDYCSGSGDFSSYRLPEPTDI